MKLQDFIDQVVREICSGSTDAGSPIPSVVEMDIAITPDGRVCSQHSKPAGRIKLAIFILVPPSAESLCETINDTPLGLQSCAIQQNFMSPKTDNLLAVLSDAWTHSPHKLLSLRDMIQIVIDRFGIGINGLEEWRDVAQQAFETGGPGHEASEDIKRAIRGNLKRLKAFCEITHLAGTINHIETLDSRIFGAVDFKNCSNEVVVSGVESVQTALWRELSQRQFVFIPPQSERVFEQETLLGAEVNAAFPSTRKDIRDAGNCLALDLNTSAAFHLMRVAEFGLRALAEHLQCPLGCPIEFETWGRLADKIDGKLEAIKNTIPKSSEREDALQFYSGLVRDIHAFQYAWRDPVMHCRSRFDDPKEAKDILSHVRRFMETLAKRVSEV